MIEEVVSEDSNNVVSAVRDIVKHHTIKLKNLKDNLSHWEEECWTDAELLECEGMISVLAAILSDLNKVLNREK